MNSNNHTYSGIRRAKTRDSIICSLCKNKKVLHIGATDSPYTEDKFKNGLLLHTQLMQCSSEVYGIDIDQKAISFLQSQGISNITYHDMNYVKNLDYTPDVIIFGEIIEHLQNLQLALTTLKSIMTPETKLIISTPNLLSILSFMSSFLLNREWIHEDHKVGFTYGLLNQLLVANNLQVETFYFTYLPLSKCWWPRVIPEIISYIRPCISDTLLAIATLAPPLPSNLKTK